MKISNIVKTVLVFSLVMFLYSCNDIDKPYEESTTPADTTTTKYKKNIFLEDYTGFNCPNCPKAVAQIEILKALYGDRLIVVSVHAGFFATPSTTDSNFMYDFRIAAGVQWNKMFGIQEYPSGLVNRKGVKDQTHILAPTAWGERAATVAAEEPEMTVNITPKYTEGGSTIGADVNVDFVKESSTKYNLSVILVQDSIIGSQNNSGVTIKDYVHNHVLRAVLNSTWGEALNADAVAKGAKFSKSYTIDIKNDAVHPWVPAHMKLIAFVYNVDTYEVMQAAQVNVK